MSPNPNYKAGRAFEYERRLAWRKEGYEALRTAGSHGSFDIIAVKDGEPVHLIQCKRADDTATAKRLADKFRASPPYPRNEHFYQWMEIRVKGQKKGEAIRILV